MLFKHGVSVDTAQVQLKGVSLKDMDFAIVICIFSLVGFESATTLGSEAKRPLRNVPRAVIWSLLITGAFMVFMSYVEVFATHHMGISLGTLATPLTNISSAYDVSFFKVPVALGAMVSFFSLSLSCLNAGARIIFPLGGHGFVSKRMHAVHAKNMTPHVALGTYGAIILGVALHPARDGDEPADALRRRRHTGGVRFLFAYFMITVAAPFYLRKIGELRSAPRGDRRRRVRLPDGADGRQLLPGAAVAGQPVPLLFLAFMLRRRCAALPDAPRPAGVARRASSATSSAALEPPRRTRRRVSEETHHLPHPHPHRPPGASRTCVRRRRGRADHDHVQRDRVGRRLTSDTIEQERDVGSGDWGDADVPPPLAGIRERTHRRQDDLGVSVTGLHTYPVKSCAGVALTAGAHDAARDRARPGLHAGRRRQRLRLAAQGPRARARAADDRRALDHPVRRPAWRPSMLPLDIEPDDNRLLTATVHGRPVASQLMDDELCDWFTTFLPPYKQNRRFRLVHVRADVPGYIKDRYRREDASNQVGFADGNAMLLASEPSLAALNAHLDEPVPMNRFRPNIVVGGNDLAPYDEDHWTEVRLGALAAYVVKGCDRCSIPDTDQRTATVGKAVRVALRTRRGVNAHDPANTGVFFAQNLNHVYAPGTVVALGDCVRVIARSATPNVVIEAR